MECGTLTHVLQAPGGGLHAISAERSSPVQHIFSIVCVAIINSNHYILPGWQGRGNSNIQAKIVVFNSAGWRAGAPSVFLFIARWPLANNPALTRSSEGTCPFAVSKTPSRPQTRAKDKITTTWLMR